jgi:hypothetical protein
MSPARQVVKAPSWMTGDPFQGHLVEVEARPDPGIYESAYDVYIDGRKIARVVSDHVESNVPAGRGGMLRRVIGHPKKWWIDFVYHNPSHEAVRGHRLKTDTRAQTVVRVFRNHFDPKES